MTYQHVNKTHWLSATRTALLKHIPLKVTGLTTLITLFFMAYFHVLKHPVYPTTLIPLTIVDRLISFQPYALPIYLSLWVYVATPVVLMNSRRELFQFAVFMMTMCGVGLTIFYFWPNAITPPEINWNLYPNISFLKNIDAAGNACPSLHVATAFLSAAWIMRLLKRYQTPIWLEILNIIWCISIIYSTLATKQHVALDVVGGLVLGLFTILLLSMTIWKK